MAWPPVNSCCGCGVCCAGSCCCGCPVVCGGCGCNCCCGCCLCSGLMSSLWSWLRPFWILPPSNAKTERDEPFFALGSVGGVTPLKRPSTGGVVLEEGVLLNGSLIAMLAATPSGGLELLLAVVGVEVDKLPLPSNCPLSLFKSSETPALEALIWPLLSVDGESAVEPTLSARPLPPLTDGFA